MVMASAGPLPRHDAPHEEAERGDAAAAAALHERLVAYVHALAGGHEARRGVWVEHSYARASGTPPAPAAHVRVLLAPALAPAPDGEPDVLRPAPSPPAPPPDEDDRVPGEDADDEPADDDERSARLAALAPGAAHARLAESALDALRRLRLARLAGGARAEATRAAARRLRLALAGAAPRRAPAWLHAALPPLLARGERALYDAVVAELRRAAPRLAERLAGAAGADARAPAPPPAPAPGAAGPLLLWLGGVRPGLEARWARRLGALLATRAVAAPAAAAAAPGAWCAATAAGARAALADALAEAGERAVILGGAGAGAALCAALAAALGAGGAGGGRVRGLLLLAPPLHTAEGARLAPDEPLAELRVPLLLVVGSGAAGAWRGAAREAGRARAARRVLEVHGADDALRVPRAVRARLRLPQRALDAAVAEECARWAIETAESAEAESPPRERDRERPRRRGAGAEPEDEEYAHLPAAAAAAPASGSDRSIEIVEGRVVSRGSGSTPLALLPPRREPREPAPLAAADIMQLPIVFADDEPPAPAAPAAPASPVTVTSGAGGRYARVIVAKRGAPAGPRPVLLRRGLRFVPRDADA